MDDQLKEIFAKLRETCDFANVDFSDVNACGSDGGGWPIQAVFWLEWGNSTAAQSVPGAGLRLIPRLQSCR
jgi:hypothetical protein